MRCSIRTVVCLTALCAGALFPQLIPAQIEEVTPEKTEAPVAFIYVSNVVNPNVTYDKDNVYAFTAAANGKLTKVSGSPFNYNIFDMGVNGKYLFGAESDGTTIDSFLMESNGSIHRVESKNTRTYNPGGCGAPGEFKIDHSGSTLYNTIEDPDCFGTHIQFFKIKDSSGKLSYLGDTSELGTGIFEVDFLGNNDFAYSPQCTVFDHEEVGGTYGYQRHSGGELTELNLGVVGPQPPENGNSYCPTAFATDPTHHMAALLYDEDADGDVYGNPVIATYSADANGNLTTASTPKNMGVVTVTGMYGGSMRMSTSGQLLAVGGQSGLKIFHFDGDQQVKEYKTLLTYESVGQPFWDKNDHLYVVTGTHSGDGKLHVYTVTPTGFSAAPGSPYAIPNPNYMIVQTK